MILDKYLLIIEIQWLEYLKYSIYHSGLCSPTSIILYRTNSLKDFSLYLYEKIYQNETFNS